MVLHMGYRPNFLNCPVVAQTAHINEDSQSPNDKIGLYRQFVGKTICERTAESLTLQAPICSYQLCPGPQPGPHAPVLTLLHRTLLFSLVMHTVFTPARRNTTIFYKSSFLLRLAVT